MKKIIFIVSLSMMLFSCSKDNMNVNPSDNSGSLGKYELTANEAKAILLDFKSDRVDTKSTSTFKINSQEVVTYEVNNVKTKSGEESYEIPVYEFLTETNGKKGYSVVIGDKRIQKVIADVEQGQITDTLDIEPLKEFFDYIPTAIKNDLDIYYSDNKKEIVTTKVTVTTYYNFLPTIWNQDYPYNCKFPSTLYTDCLPTRFNGKYAVGCVPLAVAQIMAFHRTPSNMDWNSILSSSIITTNSSPAVIDAVGNFLFSLATALNVNYSCNGTGVTNPNVVALLQSYGFLCDSYANYNFSLVSTSLENGRPVYFSGKLAAGSYHDWICDAWRRHDYGNNEIYDYLNMNWGWGGDSNGFFYVNNPMSFDTSRGTFCQNFKVITNIRKS